MALGSTVRIDHKGRVALPKDIREAMDVGAGDTLSLGYEPKRKILRLARATSPFDILAEHAVKECETGRTKDLRDYAREQGLKVT